MMVFDTLADYVLPFLIVVVGFILVVNLLFYNKGVSFRDVTLIVTVVVIGFVYLVSVNAYAYVNDKMSNAYTVYYAYEDGNVSEDELMAFKRFDVSSNFEVDEVIKAVNGKDVSEDELKVYEDLVNEVLDEADSDGNKIDFKKKVLNEREDDLKTLWNDGKLDASERELLTFAGDVARLSVDDVIENLEDGDYEGSVEMLDKLFVELDDRLYGFSYAKGSLSEDGSGLYKVTD